MPAGGALQGLVQQGVADAEGFAKREPIGIGSRQARLELWGASCAHPCVFIRVGCSISGSEHVVPDQWLRRRRFG